MAKIQNPALSLLASGSIGKITFGRNQFGPWAREKKTAIQPNTPLQISQKEFMRNAALAWTALSNAERDQWMNISDTVRLTDRLGKATRYNGRLLFMRLHMLAQRAGIPNHNWPAAPHITTYFPAITFSQTIAGITVSATPHPSPHSAVIVQGTGPQYVTRMTCPAQISYLGRLNHWEPNPAVVIPNAALDPAIRRYWFRVTTIGDNNWPAPATFAYLDAERQTSGFSLQALRSILIYNDTPNANYFTTPYIDTYRFDGVHTRSLLYFDLSPLPQGGPCASATLTLHTTGVTAGPTTDHIFAHPLAIVWADEEATWNSRMTGFPWATPGALNQGNDFLANPHVSAIAPPHDQAVQWHLNMKPILDAWLTGAIANQGIVIGFNNASGNNGRRFASRIHSNTAWRPKLQVDF